MVPICFAPLAPTFLVNSAYRSTEQVMITSALAATKARSRLILFKNFILLFFFGKGIGALGWAVNSDTAPKQIAGLSGAVLNTCGNLSSITTPIAIGYIIESTGSFNGALVYVGAHAFVAIVCYLFVVGKIQRVTLK